MRHFILIGLFLILSSNLIGQKTTIIVSDAQTKKTVIMAHVCFESENKLKTFSKVTDEKGSVWLEISTSGKIAISCMGYENLISVIEPGRTYQFALIPSLFEVGEVVITGQVTAQNKDNSIYPVSVINSQQLRDKAANNLTDALAGQLTINPVNNGILGKGISMLGISGENIKILVDGVPIIGRQNGNVDLEQINLTNTDHIEMVEGPMSVIYGSNALGGVINIISRNNYNQNLTGVINGYYESVGVYNTDANISVGLYNHHFSIGGGRNFFDGFQFDKSKRSMDFNPKEQYFGNLNYSYKTGKNHFQLTQELFSEQLRDLDSVKYGVNRITDGYHFTHRYNTRLYYDFQPDTIQSFMLTGAYSYYNKIKLTKVKNMVTLDQWTSPDKSSNDTTFFDNWFFRGTYSYKGNKTEWQTGTDASLERGNGKRLDATKKIDEYAVFASLKYQLIPSLAIQTGARAIYNTKYNAPLVYSINGLWLPAGILSIRASVGTGFRSPSLKELYLDFVDINHNVHGNPDLKAESSVNYNLVVKKNFEKNKNRFEYQIQFYHNRIKDKIDLMVWSGSSTKADYMNIDGTFKTLGVISGMDYQFHPALKISAGIVYGGKSKLANLDQYTYSTDVNGNISYHNIKYNFRVNLFYKYYGKVTQYIKDEEDETRITESWIDHYQMMDLTVNRPFWNEQIMLALGIKNILNYKQIEQYGSMGTSVHGSSGDGVQDISWGRSYFIKVSFRFSNSKDHE
jgi:outer membrane receptor for ferrienterochelin and colicins